MNKFRILLLAFTTITMYASADKKVYIDIDAIDTFEATFHIHEGNNVWFEINAIYSDTHGFYTYENNIKKNGEEVAKLWKCPYCHYMWPQDVFPCQNLECPSRKNK